MDKSKRDGSEKETVLEVRAVISSPKKDKDYAHRDGQRCAFYLRTKDVTPRPLNSVNNPVPPDDSTGMPRKNRLWTKLGPNHQRNEGTDRRHFLDINADTVDELLDGLIVTRRRFCGGHPDGAAYDPGPDHPQPHRDVVITDTAAEVELVESPTFVILDLSGGVVVKGDGRQDIGVRISEDDGQDGTQLPLNRADNVAQTVNYFADRADAECQTYVCPTISAGTQVHGFEVVDVSGGHPPERADDGRTGRFDMTVMFLERALARNALDTGRSTTSANGPRPDIQTNLTYSFALTLRTGVEGPLPVGRMHWNEAAPHLCAVSYVRRPYDKGLAGANAVAVWNTRNPCNPERFYEFGDSTITCLKFSIENPNRLAVGFYDGEILIIDISSKSLRIVFQKSKQSALETDGILDLFWIIRVENQFLRLGQYECLVTCSFTGRVALHRYLGDTFEEKSIMSLPGNEDGGARHRVNHRQGPDDDDDPDRRPAPACSATALLGLDKNVYLVGTLDGVVYACTYDEPIKYTSRTAAHLGAIRSLEKSPYVDHVYLTTGCDCTVNVWAGDAFVEPVIALHSGRQIEQAVWSRTSSTVIVSLIDDSVHVWDMDVSQDAPVSVRNVQQRSGRQCTGLEFTPDGQHLCVFDSGGNVSVYTWSSSGKRNELDDLTYCIANSLYGQTYLAKTLCKFRPEYVNAFARLHNETQRSFFG